MADMVIVMLGLLGGLLSYLVNPCGIEQWGVVKASHHDDSVPTSSRGADRAPEPGAEATFDRDLAGVPA